MTRDEKMYINANKIRTKLLLFIDNELKQKHKNPEQKFIKEYHITEEKITIDYKEIKNDIILYSYSNGFFLPSKIKRTFIPIKLNILSPSTVDNTPYEDKIKNFMNQNYNMRNVYQHRTNQEKLKKKLEINVRKKKIINSVKFNKSIEFDDNKYYIRTKTKKSSVVLVEKTIKKDKNYLKNLCKKLKKPKKNLSSIRVPKNKSKTKTISIINKKFLEPGLRNSTPGFKHQVCSVNKKNTDNNCLCKLIKDNCKE